MSFDSLLVHSCSIERATSSDDAYGNASLVWTEIYSGVPCRLIEKTDRLVDPQKAQSTFITSYMLLVLPEYDIKERDRITQIDLGVPRELPAAFVIKNVTLRNGVTARHSSLSLEAVK